MTPADEHSLLEVVRLSTDYLRSRGVESPRLDSELLAAHALGLNRMQLYLQYDRPLVPDEVAAIRELVRRRIRHEPVAYIVGEKEFWSRSFHVDARVLIPRPDTETLVETVLRRLRAEGRPRRGIDLGTGSGCIAITLAAELPGLGMVAVDVSDGALEVAALNVDRHGLTERVELRSGSWWDAVRDDEFFDVVVANPPYVEAAEMATLAPDVAGHEPALALTGEGETMDGYRSIFEGAARHCSEAGLVAVEVAPARAAAVAELAAAALPGRSIEMVSDLTARSRVVVAS